MLAGANPTIFGVPIPPDHLANIDRYTGVFLDKLEAVARAALKDMRPARLSWGVGSVGFAKNRRTPGGPTDHDLPVLVVKDDHGVVRAVYATYACHAVTLSNNRIGGDWPGFAAAAIEDAYPGAVGLVSIGCGADQNPSSGVTGDKVAVAEAEGREVAAEVRRVAGQYLAPVSGKLTSRVTTVELPLIDPPPRTEWEGKAMKMDPVGHHARVTLAKLDRGEALPAAVTYPVQTWAFGDSLAMVHLPGEVVVDYAKRLKDELDGRRVWLTAYANNAPCYVPSERVLKEGRYEGGGAMIYYDPGRPFKPGLEAKIVDAVKGQIGTAFAAKFDPAKTSGTRPRSPQQSLAAITPRPGMRVDLVAAEPLVADPVALAFGPDGRLWAAEMGDYPNGPTGGRVVSLSDADGDGRFDASTVFLDGLPYPTGLLPWRKGMLICAAPDILYAEDTNGDGRAEKVEKLYSGFGTTNFQARVNGLAYGLDGWVYGSCGLFGGDIRCHKTGKTVALGDRDFRIKPDTGELEPASGRTQHGRPRDDAGDWFGCDNSNLCRHYPLADHYLRRNPFAAAKVTSVPVGPNRVVPARADAQRFALSGPPGKVTAGCGLTIYRDDLLGPAFAGNAFCCEPVNLVVTRLSLTTKDSTFAGSRAADEQDREFLASSDGWFRPVWTATGPDGGLWVADMYRFLIEHPRWIPPADLAKIDPRAGAGLGRVYRVLPEGASPRPWVKLDRLDAAGLVAALDSPNGWQRDMATQFLMWYPAPVAREPLENLASACPRGLARLHALVALDGLGWLRPALVASALTDKDAAVRRHAVRLAEQFASDNADVADALLKRAADPDPQVRLQLAFALGQWSDPRAGMALAGLARSTGGDALLMSAVLSSLTRANLPAFAEGLFPDPPAAAVPGLFATAAGFGGTEVLAAAARPRDGKYRTWQLAAAAAALDASDRADTRSVLAPTVAFARKAVADASASPDIVAAAARLLGRDPADRTADTATLAGLHSPTRPTALQSVAITELGRVGGDAAVNALLAAWPAATPGLRTSILDALLSRPAWAASLLAAAEKGAVAPGQIDAGRRQRLLDHPDAAVREKAAKVFAGAADPDRAKVLAAYDPAADRPGDRLKGKAVFARVCAACHALDGVGSAVGPDLAPLAVKTPRYLLGEILDPSRNLDSRYVEYQATTADGRTVTGLLLSESATAVTLRGQQGRDETILRADLEMLRGTAKSLMPAGLENDIPVSEMADLLAYLTNRPSAPSDLARRLLDDATPAAERGALVAAVTDPAAVVRALTADLPDDPKEEYRRIPWIWRVAIAAGRETTPTSCGGCSTRHCRGPASRCGTGKPSSSAAGSSTASAWKAAGRPNASANS